MKFLPWFLPAFFWLAACASHAPSDLAPFRSDDCTAFPEGTVERRWLWADCCLQHDIAYWLGGSYHERLRADAELYQCLKEHDLPVPRSQVLHAVRLAGSPYFPSSFRWGYGWPYPRGYRPLTPDERAHAALALERTGNIVPGWLLFPPGP